MSDYSISPITGVKTDTFLEMLREQFQKSLWKTVPYSPTTSTKSKQQKLFPLSVIK